MEGNIRVFEPEEEIVLNMGPQHPSTHGVLRLILKLSGEKIVDAKPDIGFLHRGVEKLGETYTYIQFLPMLDRNDYLSATTNEFGYVLAVEKLANIPVPERAQYIRVLFSELSRIASHLVWLGTFCLDLGGALGGGTTIFLYCFREREKILDIFEKMTGSRLHPHLMQIGGVRYDVYPGIEKDLKEILKDVEDKINEYEEMLVNNPVFIDRTKGVGVLPKEVAMEYGCSGPVLRGSGVKFDLRKAVPYSSYDKFDFDVPCFDGGDVFDRFRVRMEEMRQSIKIIRQALDGLPEDPISSQMPVKVKVAIKPPPGEVYVAIESPRGELGYYIYSDGKPVAYRMKIRAPSFSNLSVLPFLLKGHLVADVVAILGSLDPVFGDVDR
ncbi:MAG: NADH-quinone oxidoreductase subunit D [Candidatus Hydrothermales bacterium]